MQPVASSLSELIEQLGRTYSPFERLKILGRAWALLRKMTPEQRVTVAAQLGLDRADELVEAIAERSGTQAAPALLAMIERAQVKGREHLPELLADLRDPSRRAERLRQGAKAALEEAETALAGETPEVPWLPPAAVAPPRAPRVTPAPAAAPRAQAPRSKAPPEPAPAAAAPAPLPATPVPPPVQAPAPAVVLEPVPATPPPPPVQRAPEPPRAAVAPAATPDPRPAPVRPAGDRALTARLAAASSLTDKFHLLRRNLRETKELPADDLRAVLEAFPDGWARRRALAALLRSGAPGSLRDALALVEALGSDRDRLWCLGTLADSRKIAGEERQALLAFVASPVARRRLEVRLGER